MEKICVYKCDVCLTLYPQEGYGSCSCPCRDDCFSYTNQRSDACLKMVTKEEARKYYIVKDPKLGSIYIAKYRHDCSGCIYLGSDRKDDFYFCASLAHPKASTLIARHSNRGSDYTSFDLWTMEALNKGHRKNDYFWCLNKALKLAKEKNLVLERKGELFHDGTKNDASRLSL